MAIDDVALVDLAAAIYDPQPDDFDKIVQVDPTGPVIGIKHGDGFDLLAARGSVTAQDWMRDFDSELGVAVRGYLQLGMLPHGFAQHMADTYEAVRQELQPKADLYGTGHSLGGPEALYQCAAHSIAGGTVKRIALFESPKPGTRTFTKFFAFCPISSWWNMGDVVPEAPLAVPFLLEWERPRLDTRFDLGPSDPGSRHSIKLCQQAVRARAAGGTP